MTFSFNGFSQDSDSPFVNYDQFEALVKEVREHRKERLLPIDDFNAMSKKEDVVILDTRSKAMYDLKHIKGAVHLNFSDFTQANLDNLFGSRDVTILIYCNNNIEENPLSLEEIEEEFFPSKLAMPAVELEDNELLDSEDRGSLETSDSPQAPLTLALNIPTYINLFGYGYKNVYELKDLVAVNDERISFEGYAVPIID
ncbi:MAG: hypothetical protein ACI837_002590 [Crocinitomicaceae bacterium]|jgi:hypothetical protein